MADKTTRTPIGVLPIHYSAIQLEIVFRREIGRLETAWYG